MKLRASIFLLITSSIIIYCTSCSENKSVRIIENSIAAHGGSKAWDNMEAFSIQKETWLYFENGELESHLIQDLEFRNTPFFEGKISWEKDSLVHKLVFDGSRTRYWMGENEIQNEDFLANKKKDIDAAYYVLNKPFDLINGNKKLDYQGITKLQDGREVETVRVIDGNPNDPGADVWWYYFEKDSKLLVAYKVKTSGHYSLVYNLEWDVSTGIHFPKRRESYRVDSLGNTLYLRAKYQFGDFRSD